MTPFSPTRRFSDLRKPCALHVSRAEEGQAASLRRDPEDGGRILPVPWRLCGPAGGAEARQSGVPHPRRQSARQCAAGELCAAAEPGGGGGHQRQGSALGLRFALCARRDCGNPAGTSEEHTSELQSLMRISYAVFCLKKKKTRHNTT